MKITITGRPISKKNSKIVGRNRYSGKQFFTSSKQWQTFEKDALNQLLGVSAKFTGNFRIDYKFSCYKGLSLDVDNAISGINDILQLAGIIDDDKNLTLGSFEKIPQCLEWKSEIEITQL